MKQKIKQFAKSILVGAFIMALSQTNSKAQDEQLGNEYGITPATGCKYTGISTDYCVFGSYYVTNCCNTTSTTTCGY